MFFLPLGGFSLWLLLFSACACYISQFSVIYFRVKLFICRASPQAVTSEVLSPYPYIVWGPFSASVHWNLVASAGLSNLAMNQKTCAFYAVLDLSLAHVEINVKTYYVACCQLLSTGAGASRPCFLSRIQTHSHHNFILLHPC